MLHQGVRGSCSSYFASPFVFSLGYEYGEFL